EDYLERDPALGGPDTTTQARIVWAVRTSDALSVKTVKDFTDDLKAAWQEWYIANLRRAPRGPGATGRLLPQLHPFTDPQAAEADVPCVADPAGGYRGLEN